MIPCQKSCSAYCEGCHKSCAEWRQFQTRLREERQAKKDYLNYYNELWGAIPAQCRAMEAYGGPRKKNDMLESSPPRGRRRFFSQMICWKKENFLQLSRKEGSLMM